MCFVLTDIASPVDQTGEAFLFLLVSLIEKGKDYDQAKPFEYFDKGRKRRWMHPETSRKLEELLVMLRDKGEGETFYYIRHVVKVQGKKDKAHWK